MSGSTLTEYVLGVLGGDTWLDGALCAGSTHEMRERWTCTEDQTFEMIDGTTITGYDVQCYLVDNICRHCPVQWECARNGLREEIEAGDRSTGAWAMTRRDRRWFHHQDDNLGQIDLAKMHGEPIVEMIWRLRDERD